MKNYFILFITALVLCTVGCKNNPKPVITQAAEPDSLFQWKTEAFADVQVLRYRVKSFDKLTLNQKLLVYYLTQAGLSGRDIHYDQNYKYNLTIRRALEKILTNYKGDKSGNDWMNFMTYTKQVWFGSGIHHHYSADKIIPKFSKDYFTGLMKETGTQVSDEVLTAIFDPKVDIKKVSLDPSKDLIASSAVNFYDKGIKEDEVVAFYKNLKNTMKDSFIAYGINSKLAIGKDGKLFEKVWKKDGMYGQAISEIIKWLEKAVGVAENQKQADALKLLITYYTTGDLKKWDEYNIAWAQAKEGDIDYINSFIEVYNDPKGFKGSYESIIEITDFEASKRMKVLSENAQWFEDNSPIMAQHKKKKVNGVSYKVVDVAGESGDAAPLTPIGVNVPNSEWIRQKYGSKSVSLGNIITAYGFSSGKGVYNEFSPSPEVTARFKQYGALCEEMHTALHEVIGHASGQIEKGVEDPSITLKNYASTMEEARADIVGLYYIMDKKLVELGLIPSLEVGKAQYDNYISNGLMKQLRRIEPGKNIEESHMRNRQMIAAYAYEQGQKENVISKITKDGKTYFQVNDYDKLRAIFANLLREIQRIKSQGDYNAARKLVETYGVKVDQKMLAEVRERASKLNIPPYSGFIQPEYSPVTDKDGKIIDVKIEYPKDFTEQMLRYAAKYSFLPDMN